MTIRDYPVAIIGAGPVGMAAAAQLTLRNIPFLLFEAGQTVGANLLEWGHVRVFSPWRYNIDKAAKALLEGTAWQKPADDGLPTGQEIVNSYLLPLSLHPRIKPQLHLSAKVISITRKGIHKMRTAGRENVPFVLQISEAGMLISYEASAVIDASGTWQNPNPIGAGGVFAAGELALAHRITYRIPDILGKDKLRYANKVVVVVGGGHSAVNSLLDLASLKAAYPRTIIHWVLQNRNLASVYGGKEDDALEARGALGIRIEKLVNSRQLSIHSPYFIRELTEHKDKINIKGNSGERDHEITEVDEIIANTGARPDLSILREVRVQTDAALESVPALAELIDPNIHSCGTVRSHGERELRQPESNFYLVGAKSYGRAPTFLMATGYEQVRSIAAWLDRDLAAASRVELDLPQTGVCSSNAETDVCSSNLAPDAGCCDTGLATEASETKQGALYSPTNDKTLNPEIMEKEFTTHTMDQSAVAAGCCGGAPTAIAEACCKLDEEKKAEGLSGCGCHDTAVLLG